jgi:hypothetical protein
MLLEKIEISKKQYYKEKPFVKQNKTKQHGKSMKLTRFYVCRIFVIKRISKSFISRKID